MTLEPTWTCGNLGYVKNGEAMDLDKTLVVKDAKTWLKLGQNTKLLAMILIFSQMVNIEGLWDM